MPRYATSTQARRREAGFTLMEMVIAMVVMAIIITMGLQAFGGAKKSTYANEAKTVGSAYMQVLSQHHVDFANRRPDAAHWSGNNTPAAQRGPLNLTNQPYMKSMPDSVSAGRVGVSVNTNCGTSATPSAPTGAGEETGWVAICYLTDPQFYVRVTSHKASGAPWDAANGGAVCFMGATTAVPRC